MVRNYSQNEASFGEYYPKRFNMFWIYPDPEWYFAGLRNLEVICDRYVDIWTIDESIKIYPFFIRSLSVNKLQSISELTKTSIEGMRDDLKPMARQP